MLMKNLIKHTFVTAILFYCITLHAMETTPTKRITRSMAAKTEEPQPKKARPDMSFSCPFEECNEDNTFDEEIDLAEHLLQKHAACWTCYSDNKQVSYSFKTRRKLINHCIKKDHALLYCAECYASKNKCVFITLNNDYLTKHLTLCSSINFCNKKRDLYCSIDGCNRNKKPYSNPYDLYSHLASAHHICPFCPESISFDSRANLIEHAKHMSHPRFYCLYCEERIAVNREHDLRKHESTCSEKPSWLNPVDTELLIFLKESLESLNQ